MKVSHALDNATSRPWRWQPSLEDQRPWKSICPCSKSCWSRTRGRDFTARWPPLIAWSGWYLNKMYAHTTVHGLLFYGEKKVTSRSMIRVAKKGSLSSSHSTLSSPASGNLGTGQSHEASEQRRRRHNPVKRKDEGKSSDSNNSMNMSARAGEKGKPTTNV